MCTYMWRVDRWNILHALSLNMARCFASLFSRHISQTFHSQRFKIQQNHQTHYDWSECQPKIELKYFLFVSYMKMYSICQISTTARVCRGFAKDVAIIHSNCYLNLQWGEGVMLNTYQQALSSASYSKPNSSFIIMIGIFFSFKILTIFSLNDWTKRQFRNLDKDSDSKSCPHFRFKIFVI